MFADTFFSGQIFRHYILLTSLYVCLQILYIIIGSIDKLFIFKRLTLR